MPPDAPNTKVPSLAGVNALVTEEPLPVKATFATVLSTAKVVTSTSAESVAVPPTSAKVKVVTPLIAPDAVMSVLATLSPVESVNVLEPPVTAAMVISPAVSVASVSMVVLLPKVTAPKTIASLEVSISPFKVTVPPTDVVVSPPLKVKVSPVASPNCKVPSFANEIALVTDEPSPFKATFATVLSTAKVVTSTSPAKVAVPPTLASVYVVTPLMFPDAVMSALATLFSVVNVKVLLPPVTAAMVISPAVSVALVSIVVALPKVTAPSTMASLEVAKVPLTVTVPPTDVVVSPAL